MTDYVAIFSSVITLCIKQLSVFPTAPSRNDMLITEDH